MAGYGKNLNALCDWDSMRGSKYSVWLKLIQTDFMRAVQEDGSVKRFHVFDCDLSDWTGFHEGGRLEIVITRCKTKTVFKWDFMRVVAKRGSTVL